MFTPNSAGDDASGGLTLRDCLVPVFRHWRSGLLVGSLLFAATLLGALMLPTAYEAQMKILVRRERVDQIVSADSTATSHSGAEVTDNELNLEAELLKGHDLLEQVVVAAGLAHGEPSPPSSRLPASAGDIERSLAVRQMEKVLKVEPIRKTNLIKVTYRSSDARQAAGVLDTLSTLYLKKHLALQRPPGAFDFFSAQADRFRTELGQAEDRLKHFGQSENVVSADLEKESTLQRLAEFEAALQQARGAIADSVGRLSELEMATVSTPSRQTTQIRTSDNGELLRELKSRILTLEVKRTEMLSKFAPSYPPVIAVDAELAQARAALELTERTPLTDETTDQNPTVQWLHTERARVKTERAAAEARAAALADTVRLYRAKARDLDDKDAAQHDLKRNIKSAEETYLLYARKQEEARISDALDLTRIANVTVAEPPTIPSTPSSSGALLVVTLGGFLAILMGLMATYLLDYLSPYVRTPAEVEAILMVPVLATLSSDGAA